MVVCLAVKMVDGLVAMSVGGLVGDLVVKTVDVWAFWWVEQLVALMADWSVTMMAAPLVFHLAASRDCW